MKATSGYHELTRFEEERASTKRNFSVKTFQERLVSTKISCRKFSKIGSNWCYKESRTLNLLDQKKALSKFSENRFTPRENP